jgi:hypothetical protein
MDDAVRVRQIDAVAAPSGVIDEARGPTQSLAPKDGIALAVQAGFLGAIWDNVLEELVVEWLPPIREIHVA